MRLYRLVVNSENNGAGAGAAEGQNSDFSTPNFPNRKTCDVYVEDIEANKNPRDANFYGFHRAWNRPVKLWDPLTGHHCLASFGGQFDVSGNNTDTLLLDLEKMEWSVVASHRNNTGLPASVAFNSATTPGSLSGSTGQLRSQIVVPDGRIAHSTISRKSLDCGDRSTRHVILDHRHTRMVIFGGFDGNNFLSDTWEFDMESRQWICLDKGSGSINTAIGGGGGGGGASGGAADVNRPAARCSHTCVATSDGSKMILFGGWQGDSSTRFNDVWIFHFGVRRWEKL